MSSIVKYNSKYLVPVSNVGITHTMSSNVTDQITHPIYSIDLNGYLIFNAGSPTSSGTFGDYTAEQCETIDSDERLNALLGKHCALGSLFSENYQELELGTTTGSPNLIAYPRVVSVSLTDTSNPSYWAYTVSLEADNLYCSGVPIASTGYPCVKSFEESWDITYDESEFLSESGDNRLFRVSHSISAVGLGVANSGGLVTSPYNCAKNFVCDRKGSNAVVPSVCIDGFACTGTKYNYYESHNADTANGSYSLQENWICTTGAYIENYSVETQESSDTACPTVSIQGSIKGFETRSSGVITSSRYQNAKSRWDALVAVTGALARAEEVSGYDLDENPLSGTVGRNTFTGEITFNYSYRKLPFKWLNSAKFEKIDFSNNWGEDSYASVQLLQGGEVLHPSNYNSSGVRVGVKLLKRSLNINAVYPCGTGISKFGPRFTSPHSTELQAVVDYYNPTGDLSNYFTVVDSQTENWDYQTGSYSYSISFTSQPTGQCELF